jgi:hypothetical protein
MIIPDYINEYRTIHPNRNFWDPPVIVIHKRVPWGWEEHEDPDHPYYTEEQSHANLIEQTKCWFPKKEKISWWKKLLKGIRK